MSYDSLERSKHDGSKIELYLFETEDGIHKWAYTTDRKPITALGSVFLPENIKRSELKQNAGESSSEKLTINLPYDNPVSIIHVPYLPPRPIRVTVYGYQRRDVTVEIKQGFTGYVTTFGQKGEEAELQCSQIIDTFQQTVPWAVFKQGCIWNTYGEGCGLDNVAFLTLATVESSAADTIQSAAFATQPAGWFQAGYAVNPASGETRFVTWHAGNLIKVVHAFTNLLPGMRLNVYAGDDHTEETCRTKFNNKYRYTGFDHQPNYNVFLKGTL